MGKPSGWLVLGLRAERGDLGSEEFDFPLAKRRGLQVELDKIIRAEARKRDTSEDKLKKQIVSGDLDISSGKLIVSAVRELAVRDKQTMDMITAKQQIKSLENELDRLRENIDQRASSSRRSELSGEGTRQ